MDLSWTSNCLGKRNTANRICDLCRFFGNENEKIQKAKTDNWIMKGIKMMNYD